MHTRKETASLGSVHEIVWPAADESEHDACADDSSRPPEMATWTVLLSSDSLAGGAWSTGAGRSA